MSIKGNFETGRILASIGLKNLCRGVKESLYTLDNKIHEEQSGIEALISLRLNDMANLGICAEKTANLDNIGGTMEFQFGRFSLDISGKYGSYNHSEIIYNTSLAIKVSL